MDKALSEHENIERCDERVDELPMDEEHPVIVATGPLTEDALAKSIASISGGKGLYFYDSLAPIVAAESLDLSVIFAQSRYDKGDGADYLNCPLDKSQYTQFIDALNAAECMPLHDFEEPKYFEGCLPIEVVAARGEDALRYGCMKPVGLRDPRTQSRPYAVIQLRQEDKAGQAYNLVGFQTKMKYPEQKRIFRSLPGFENVEFLRHGTIHRNTYLDSPTLLGSNMELLSHPHIHFAGQITGVEGYVESAGHGLLTGRLIAAQILGSEFPAPPADTCLGALHRHVLGHHRIKGRGHEPQNINWAMFPPLPQGVGKHERKRTRALRSTACFESWAMDNGIELAQGMVSEESLPKQPPRVRKTRSQRKQQRLEREERKAGEESEG